MSYWMKSKKRDCLHLSRLPLIAYKNISFFKVKHENRGILIINSDSTPLYNHPF